MTRKKQKTNFSDKEVMKIMLLASTMAREINSKSTLRARKAKKAWINYLDESLDKMFSRKRKTNDQ